MSENISTNISSFFKAYDIRGTCPDLSAEVYYWTGVALVELVLKPEKLPLKVNLLRDCRYSSHEFYNALALGILAAGGELNLLGLGSTDMMYASCMLWENSGAIVTASHNPKDDNGLKIVKQIPQMLGLSTGLDKIRDFVVDKMSKKENSGIFKKALEANNLLTENKESKEKLETYFFDKITQIGNTLETNDKLVKQNRKLKIVVDTANGMAGYFMNRVSSLYPEIEFVDMFWNLDGNFPNHPADPTDEKNLALLKEKVLELKADIGIAFDGDADRAFFVDESGKTIKGDFLVSYLSKILLNQLEAETDSRLNPVVVYSYPGSRCIPSSVLENGGIPAPSKQGHTFIKAKMLKYKAMYGGEATGHHYFGDFSFMDSGLIAVAIIIRELVSKNLKTSQLTSDLADIYDLSGEMNYTLKLGQNMESIKKTLLDEFSDAKFSYLDGVSLFYPSWKANFRSSNTEPVLRLNVECLKGFEPDTAAQKVDKLVTLLHLEPRAI
jgi:phosphomannomutase